MYDNYLSHHGIIGQKWGIRRYQNPDGTLTEAGRKRLNRKENKEQYKEDRKELRQNRRDVAATGKVLTSRSRFSNEQDNRTDDIMYQYSKAWNKKNIDPKEISAISSAYEKQKKSSKLVSGERARAEEMYKNAVEKYMKNNKYMEDEYGKSFKDRGNKYVKAGENKVLELMRTGANFATLPIVGNIYSTNRVTDMDFKERKNKRNSKLLDEVY